MHETDRISKYREGKMKRTLKIELKDPEIVREEPYQPRQMVEGNLALLIRGRNGAFTTGMLVIHHRVIGSGTSI